MLMAERIELGLAVEDAVAVEVNLAGHEEEGGAPGSSGFNPQNCLGGNLEEDRGCIPTRSLGGKEPRWQRRLGQRRGGGCARRP